jgi:PadR family transcriptional regulator PadR
MKINKELMKGSTTTLILSVIENEDMYGYKIVREIEKRSENVFTLKEGTLYPILHALEDSGMVESYWVDLENRKRKYYHITRKGKSQLKEKKEEFATYTNAVKRVLEYA